MSDFKVGEHVTVILTGGRLVEAEIKAIVETKQGKRLEVSFVNETARIYLWQVVEKLRQPAGSSILLWVLGAFNYFDDHVARKSVIDKLCELAKSPVVSDRNGKKHRIKPKMRMLFILCAASGLRIGEALGLRVGKVKDDGPPYHR